MHVTRGSAETGTSLTCSAGLHKNVPFSDGNPAGAAAPAADEGGSMASQGLGEIDPGWWPILKRAVAESAQTRPFPTLVALLAALVIVTVGPIWLVLHYTYLRERARQQSELAKVRADAQQRGAQDANRYPAHSARASGRR